MAGDVFFESNSLLLHCDGTAGGTAFVDSSPRAKTVTATGATIQADGKFSQSVSLNGAGWLQVPQSAEFSFGAQDFTVAAQCKFSSVPTTGGNYAGVMCCENIGTVRGWLLLLDGDAGGKLSFAIHVGGTSYAVRTAAPPPTNTFMHVAATRTDGTLRLFVDGVLVDSVSVGSGSVNNVSAVPLTVGALRNGNAAWRPMTGALDEVLINKGTALYTAAFTPPAAPYANFAGEISGTVADAAGAPVSRVIRAYHEDTGAQIASTTSNASGVYSLPFPTLAPHTLIAYPAAGENLPALVLRGVVPV